MTMSRSATKPDAIEYAPYYERYVGLVPEGDITQTLSRQINETLNVLSNIDEQKAGYRYAPDKWSIKEVIGHLIDSERVFAYRAMRFARDDRNELAGFEQDDYVRAGAFDRRSLRELLEELHHVRKATEYLLKGLSEEAWQRRGVANGNEVSVRGLAWIIAGHELHHRGVIKTKYL
jgi:uncharacterized damage-inducible protein DinB